ncbi:MAG: molybdopterin-dependent oxidoreductase [Nitrospinota bacterium]
MGGLNRRGFLKALLTGGAAAITGCSTSEPVQKLIPFLIPPEEVIPGVASWYATVCRECPAGCGMLVRVREGRAVKVEGNPQHPVNKGRLCARGQASLPGLYNPDRIREPLRRDAEGRHVPISWEEGERALIEKILGLKERKKELAFITPLMSGSLSRLVERWMAALGPGHMLTYEAFSYESLRAASLTTFGRDEVPHYALEKAKLILSFGADFLETWVSPVGYAAAFGRMHSYRKDGMGTFIYAGPRLSLTAANADEWVSVKPGSEGFLALGMLHVILKEGLSAPLPAREIKSLKSLTDSFSPESVSLRTGVPSDKIERLAKAFVQQKPSLALGGGVGASASNSTATLVAVNLLNYACGNVGETVLPAPRSNLHELSSFKDFLDLIEAMREGQVKVILLHDVNPLFTLPRRSDLMSALEKVPFKVSFSSFLDETTSRADLILPVSTPLESWGDYVPREGVHGLMQPAMRPLFNTKSLGDLLLSVTKKGGKELSEAFPWESFEKYLKDEWKGLYQRLSPGVPFESFWEEALRRGGVWWEVEGGSFRLSEEAFQVRLEEPRFEGDGAGALSLLPYPSMLHFDGRGAHKPWLQELPDPMTKIVWDSWAELHPQTARRLKLKEGDIISLESPYGKIEAPAHLFPGIRPDAVAIPIGQGHRGYGRYARERGSNPLELLPAVAEEASGGLPFLSVKVKVRRTRRRRRLITPQGSERQFRRRVAQTILISALRRLKTLGKREVHEVRDIYERHEHPAHRWGMAIDLQACIGCEACVVACYAENNLPVVGRELIAKGREMAWIWVERYFEGDGEAIEARFIPMLCQQCDFAPCEPVCPVYATYHNPEGLNAQVYNRCVGTRYCSNNCPYKVRRFNWFMYSWPEPLSLQLNPDVTVREMGVMEKYYKMTKIVVIGLHPAHPGGQGQGQG